MRGHFDKAGVTPRRHLLELRTADASEYTLGQEIKAEAFEAGELVDVSATSKGKGFAGVMKRHGFHGLRATHGVHKKHRSPGSIGGCATPGRVFKGLRMAGRMGNEQVTTQNVTRPRDRRRARPDPAQGRRSRSEGRPRADPQRREGSCQVSTVDVVVVKGDKVSKKGSAELPAELFDVQVNIPLIHQVVVAQLAAARQGTHKVKTPGRGVRWWRQAVPPEGHRSRPSGLDPRAAVHRWWRRPRPDAARLQPADPEEDDRRRAPRCALGPGPRRPRARRREVRRRRHAVHQGRAEGAGRGHRARARSWSSSSGPTSSTWLSLRNVQHVHLIARRPAERVRRAGAATRSCSPRARSTRSSPARRRASPSRLSRRRPKPEEVEA